jgi:hypothetical protein
MRRLRAALLFNSYSLEPWHLRCIDHLEQFAEVVSLIVTPDEQSSRSRPHGSRPMRRYARRVTAHVTQDVTHRFAHVPRFDQNSGRRSAELTSLDFALKLGRGSIPITIELTIRHGVWYFAHECQDDLLAFFREVYEGEHVTAAALLAADARRGEPVVLTEGYFRTERRSYRANRDRVLDGIAMWPARVCRRLLEGGDGESSPLSVDAVRQPGRSNPRPTLSRFWSRLARRRVAFAWERLFRHPQWNIGVLKAPVGTLLDTGADADDEIDWLPLDDRESFLADPFGQVHNGTMRVLCERFGYREGKGRIYTVEYSARGFTTPPEPAIALPVHMSYPFLLKGAGATYCIPETSEANEVALFRAIEFPSQWSKIAVLIERFAGVDPTVVRHEGRWWLMCTEKGPREDVELWLWHAAELKGPWIPHARNPVKTDVRGARPAGLPFIHEGQLYRPAQDCSKRYGWRLALNRVTRLTPTEFAEELVTVLEASPRSPFPKGRHTLTPVGDIVLVDGLRTVFVWPAFRAFLGIWARDLARRHLRSCRGLRT